MTADTDRPSLGFGDTLDEFDPADWQPKPRKPAPKAQAEARTHAGKAAAATGFKSREAKPAAAAQTTSAPAPVPAKPLRRRRTGRNQQFNIKARPETIAAFYAIADAEDWGLGETLEHAVAALETARKAKQG